MLFKRIHEVWMPKFVVCHLSLFVIVICRRLPLFVPCTLIILMGLSKLHLNKKQGENKKIGPTWCLPMDDKISSIQRVPREVATAPSAFSGGSFVNGLLRQTDGTQASVLIQDDRVHRGGQGGQRGGQRGHQGGRGPGKGGRGGCPDVPAAKGCLHQLHHLLPVVDGRLSVGLALRLGHLPGSYCHHQLH